MQRVQGGRHVVACLGSQVRLQAAFVDLPVHYVRELSFSQLADRFWTVAPMSASSVGIAAPS